MGLKYFLLMNNRGKLRLSKWYTTLDANEKARILKDILVMVLRRKPTECNFLLYKDCTIVYRRYAGLFLITCVPPGDNELLVLEILHRFIELLDKYFEKACEMDVIYNFEKTYYILDELLILGHMQESNKSEVLRSINNQDVCETTEFLELAWPELGEMKDEIVLSTTNDLSKKSTMAPPFNYLLRN